MPAKIDEVLKLSWTEIQQAEKRVQDHIFRTWIFRSRHFDQYVGCTAFFKLENMQRAGSAKFRGALNRIKAELERRSISGVVTYSSGDFGPAVALAAKLLNVSATVVVPSQLTGPCIDATREYGAEIIPWDENSESPSQIASVIAAKRSALLLAPKGDPLVIAGDTTAILEFIKQVPDLDVIVVPIIHGGILTGASIVTHQLNPGIQLCGARAEIFSSPDVTKFESSLDTSEFETGILLHKSPETSNGFTNKFISLSEDETTAAQLFLLQRLKILVEPSGAAAAAAVRSHKQDFAGKKIGILLTSGNVDFNQLVVHLNHSFLVEENYQTQEKYIVSCYSCRDTFDAVEAVCCNCLTTDRSFVCPSCLNCFCKATRDYTNEFWNAAPQVLWNKKQEEDHRFLIPPMNPDPHQVKKPLVLIVDDNRHFLAHATHVIRELGFGAIHAQDGEEGLRLAHLYMPELVISDSLMPKMDGREMCKRLKTSPLTSRIKVAIVTAMYSQSKHKLEAQKSFLVDEYLQKPLSFNELQALLHKYLEN